MQASLKKAKVAAKAMERAKAFIKKALIEAIVANDEADALATADEAKLGVLIVEKESATQALLAKKVAWVNVEHALVEAKKWQKDESSRLTAVKKKARIEIRKQVMAKVFECGMSFRQSVLHLIRKKHQGINLSEINFFRMEGHNTLNFDDGLTVVPGGAKDVPSTEEKADDDEVDDSASPIEDASGANLMETILTISISSYFAMNVPLLCKYMFILTFLTLLLLFYKSFLFRTLCQSRPLLDYPIIICT